MKKRILVVEDDGDLARVLSDNLTFSGFEVDCVEDGNLVLDRVRAFGPDLVLLDAMLPGRSGFDLCARISQRGRTAVIMMTIRDHKMDKVRALREGADDYVTKPFDFEELRARIGAVLRRARMTVRRLTMGDVSIDLFAMTAAAGRRRIQLTHREFALLGYLAERPGVMVHRRELLRDVWGCAEDISSRAVDQAVARLRRKIEPDPHNPRYLRSAHSDGYCLTPDSTDG